jgi:hypothetical protein
MHWLPAASAEFVSNVSFLVSRTHTPDPEPPLGTLDVQGQVSEVTCHWRRHPLVGHAGAQHQHVAVGIHRTKIIASTKACAAPAYAPHFAVPAP